MVRAAERREAGGDHHRLVDQRRRRLTEPALEASGPPDADPDPVVLRDECGAAPAPRAGRSGRPRARSVLRRGGCRAPTPAGRRFSDGPGTSAFAPLRGRSPRSAKTVAGVVDRAGRRGPTARRCLGAQITRLSGRSLRREVANLDLLERRVDVGVQAARPDRGSLAAPHLDVEPSLVDPDKLCVIRPLLGLKEQRAPTASRRPSPGSSAPFRARDRLNRDAKGVPLESTINWFNSKRSTDRLTLGRSQVRTRR